MNVNIQSRLDLTKFLRDIISRLEDEEKAIRNPVVVTLPELLNSPPTLTPFCGKISFSMGKRRFPLHSPYDRKGLFLNPISHDIIRRNCIARRERPLLTKDQNEFMLALFFNNTERAEALLKKGGVNINGYIWNRLNRPLNLAAEFGYTDLVRICLENGADPNLTDRNGNTPLQSAVSRNNIEIAKLLLEAGAKADSRNYRGLTAMELAGSKLNSGDALFSELKNKVTKQVMDLLSCYLKKQVGNQEFAEDDLLNAFQTSLSLSENKEQLKDELGSMVDKLSSLNLISSDQASSTSSATN